MSWLARRVEDLAKRGFAVLQKPRHRPTADDVPGNRALLYVDPLTGRLRLRERRNGDRAVESTGGGVTDHDDLAKLAWPLSGHTGEALGLPVFGGGGGAQTLSAPVAPRGNYVLGWTAAGALAWVALSTGMVVAGDLGIPTGDNSAGVARST